MQRLIRGLPFRKVQRGPLAVRYHEPILVRGLAMEKKRPFTELGRKIISGDHPPLPVGQTIGFRIVEIAPDEAAFEMEAVASRHANPMGTLHGGILCDLADGAMGMAWASELEEGESFTRSVMRVLVAWATRSRFLIANLAFRQSDAFPRFNTRASAANRPKGVSGLSEFA